MVPCPACEIAHEAYSTVVFWSSIQRPPMPYTEFKSHKNLEFHSNKGKPQTKQCLLQDEYFLVFEKHLAHTSRILTSV